MKKKTNSDCIIKNVIYTWDYTQFVIKKITTTVRMTKVLIDK